MILYEESSGDFVSLVEKIWMPVLVAIVGYWGSRLNLTIKKIELYSQTRFRARELKFVAYQKKLEVSGEAARIESKRHAENLLALRNIEKDNTRKMETLKSFIEVHRKHINAHYDNYMELLDEVKKSSLINTKIESQVAFVEKTFETDTENIPDEKLEDHFNALEKSYALIIKLEQNLLERKSDELFSEYL